MAKSKETLLSAQSVGGTFPRPGEVGVVARQEVEKLESVAEVSATLKEYTAFGEVDCAAMERELIEKLPAAA